MSLSYIKIITHAEDAWDAWFVPETINNDMNNNDMLFDDEDPEEMTRAQELSQMNSDEYLGEANNMLFAHLMVTMTKVNQSKVEEMEHNDQVIRNMTRDFYNQ